jgi:hypothetical protein
MAITSPQAIRFANESVRTMADQQAQTYYRAKAFLQEWAAQGIGGLIPNTADLVVDGSETDGRAPITGAKVNGLQTYLAAMVADLEANNNAKLNVLLQIAVNPSR